MSVRELLGASSSLDEKLDVESVFSTYLYTGNGSTQTITNGIDLAGKGGMVWIKRRNTTTHHLLYDSIRGTNKYLSSDTIDAQYDEDITPNISSFNSDGFLLSSLAGANSNNSPYASWTFRKASKFFDIVTYTGNGVAGRQIPHSLGCEVGMVIIKCTSLLSNWTVYHKNIGATKFLLLETTASENTSQYWFNNTTPTNSVLTLGVSANASGETYVAYLFAHDPSADGIIQCGSFTTDASNNPVTVTLTWEPQYVLVKSVSGDGGNDNWRIFDSMRGMTESGASEPILYPNINNAENTDVGMNEVRLTATGFVAKQSSSNTTYIYLAIRRPMKVPTSGTEVFQPVTYTATNVDNRLVDTGILTDMVMARSRDASPYCGFTTGDRLRGNASLGTAITDIESTDADSFMTPTVGYGNAFSAMNGFGCGNDTTRRLNYYIDKHIVYAFKRAKGFFDVVATSMTSSTINHSLGCTPELFITRTRTSASHWNVYAPSLYSGYMNLNETISVSTVYKASATATTVTYLDTWTSEPSIHYLFATLAGVSKVGSYNGNGTSQTIPCGFSTGARFILIKRTDSTGDWYVWDTARGIVAADDPHLSLNTAAAEVTTDDSIDTESSGFIVNQNTATNINVNGGSYIFLAIA